jgi:hypothetical protein
MRTTTIGILVLGLLSACAFAPYPRSGLAGADLEVVGSGKVRWPSGSPTEAPNFVWEYETTAERGDPVVPFHRMKTQLRLRYDLAEESFTWVELETSGAGHAYRQLTLTPAADGRFMIRVNTSLDGRSDDLTAVKLLVPGPVAWPREDYGIGPKDGLVEGLEVVFAEDGSFEVLSRRVAHLAGKGIRIHRETTTGSNVLERDRLDLR